MKSGMGHAPVIPALGSLKQGDHGLEGSLFCTEKAVSNKLGSLHYSEYIPLNGAISRE